VVRDLDAGGKSAVEPLDDEDLGAAGLADAPGELV